MDRTAKSTPVLWTLRKLYIGIFACTLFCALNINSLLAADLYAIQNNGDWNTAGTWSNASGGGSCGCTPGAADDIHIGENGTITVTIAANDEALSLTIYDGGTLQYLGDARLTIGAGSGLSVQSGGTIDGNGQTSPWLRLNCDLSVAGTGLIEDLSLIRFQVDGTITGDGDINCPTGELRAHLANVDIINNLTGTFTVNRIRLNAADNTFTNNGTVTVNNQLRMYSTNGTVTNNGTLSIAQNFRNNDATDNGNHIENTGIMSIGNNITMNNAAFTINNSGTFTHSGNFANIGGVETINNQVNGIWITSAESHANVNTFNASATDNTVIYNRSDGDTQDLFAPTDGSYYNLTVQGSGTKAVAATLDIDGDLSIAESATLDANANDLTIAGNWDNSGTGFTQGTQTVTFDGDANTQTIGGLTNTNFYNLVLNNTFGASPEFTLGINTTVQNAITMTTGNMDLGGFALTLGTAAGTPGTLNYTAGNFYNGSFTRWYNTVILADGNDQGLFPFADTGGNSRAFYATPATAPGTGGTITVSVSTSDQATDIGPIDDNGTDIVRQHQASWNVSTGNGLAGGNNYNLRGSGTGFGTIDDLLDLRLMTSGGVVGTDGGAGGTTSNPSIDRTGLTLAELTNSFHVGSINGTDTPLPIKLLSFDAKFEDDRVQIQWSTSSETDNDYFTIERSIDGIEYYEIAHVEGAGHSTEKLTYAYTDFNPMNGTSYYRLSQTDFDGSTETFIPVKVHQELMPTIYIFPNPMSGYQFNIQLSQQSDQPIAISIFDYAGKKVSFQSNETDNSIVISVIDQLKPGVYLVNIQNGTTTFNERLLIR